MYDIMISLEEEDWLLNPDGRGEDMWRSLRQVLRTRAMRKEEKEFLSALRGCQGLPGLGSRQFSNKESLTSSLAPL